MHHLPLQDIALADAQRGATLFRKINVPILGLVENMSYHLCPSCGWKSHIFGEDGGKRLAEKQHMELLGQVLSALALTTLCVSRAPVLASTGQPCAIPDGALGCHICEKGLQC